MTRRSFSVGGYSAKESIFISGINSALQFRLKIEAEREADYFTFKFPFVRSDYKSSSDWVFLYLDVLGEIMILIAHLPIPKVTLPGKGSWVDSTFIESD